MKKNIDGIKKRVDELNNDVDNLLLELKGEFRK